MRGLVIGFDPLTNTGAIRASDGTRFEFILADWRAAQPPRAGRSVDFNADDNSAKQIFPLTTSFDARAREYLTFLVSPHGRVSRQEYWLGFQLPVFGVAFLTGFIDAYIFPEAGDAGSWFVTVVQLLLLWPAIAVGTKRLHDRGMSGWGLVGVSAALVFFQAVSISYDPAFFGESANNRALLKSLVQGGLAGSWFGLLLLLVHLWFLKGHTGSNRFGRDPLEASVIGVDSTPEQSPATPVQAAPNIETLDTDGPTKTTAASTATAIAHFKAITASGVKTASTDVRSAFARALMFALYFLFALFMLGVFLRVSDQKPKVLGAPPQTRTLSDEESLAVRPNSGAWEPPREEMIECADGSKPRKLGTKEASCPTETGNMYQKR